MKKITILLLALLLLLTACDGSGITNTAHADDDEDWYEDGDPLEPDTEEVWEIDDDAEPQIWESEGVAYDDPHGGNQDDGWDGVPENPPVEEKLDQSEIPEGLADGLIYSAHTTVGTIVVHDTGYIFRLIDGEIVQVWDYEAGPNNVIFDASEYYEHNRDRWYGYVGNSLVHFTEDEMIVDVRSCAEFDWSGMYMYCYHIENGTLYSSSPCNDTAILDGVIEVYTKEGHTFARCLDGVYVLNASPWMLGRQSQEYSNDHPAPWVFLGTADWYDYYMQLDSRNTGKSALESAEDFDKEYGLNLDAWGNPTWDFHTVDIALTANESYQEVYDRYDVAEYRTGDEIRLTDINYDDMPGNLTYYFEDGKPSRVVWESHDNSKDALNDVLAYMGTTGILANTFTSEDGVSTEYVFSVEGGFVVHVIYQYNQNDPDSARVFFYADY